MTRWSGVKSEAEYRQDECIHRLEELDPKKEHGFKYRCQKCGKVMYRLNGILVKPLVKTA